MPESARVEAFQHGMHLGSNDIMTNNEKFHKMLAGGVMVEYFTQSGPIEVTCHILPNDRLLIVSGQSILGVAGSIDPGTDYFEFNYFIFSC